MAAETAQLSDLTPSMLAKAGRAVLRFCSNSQAPQLLAASALSAEKCTKRFCCPIVFPGPNDRLRRT